MLYDISQPVFSCEVYPGDPKPERNLLSSTEQGALYNLTAFSMCAHNGTHVDAPFHFLGDGKTIDEIPLEKFAGRAFVMSHDGNMTAGEAETILENARACSGDVWKKLLIRGNSVITEDAARIFADAGIDLIGVESQSVGPVGAPMAVHRILLRAEVVLLEGIRLSKVPDGVYFLSCAPLNLNGSDGAPCRAFLADI